MVCAVEQTIIPSITRKEPNNATYLRPIRSDKEPTKGQIPASASRFARTNQIQLQSNSQYGLLASKGINIPIKATKVRVDIRGNSTWSVSIYQSRLRVRLTKNVYRNLRASPDECHCN
jgi:hypothetical protein